MRFIKIMARKGTQLRKVIDKLIEVHGTPHVCYSSDSIALGFPEVDQTGVSEYDKYFSIDDTNYACHWYESIDYMFFELCSQFKTIYQIEIIK